MIAPFSQRMHPSKEFTGQLLGLEITIEGTGNVEVRVLAGGKTILFTIHDCWHVPSSPHHFLSSLTVTSPSRGFHIMLADRTPRLLFPQQRGLAKPNLPKYVPFAWDLEGGYFVLKFDVPAPGQVSKCNPLIAVHPATTQTPPSFSLQALLHCPFAGLSFHKTYLSNSTSSEAALVSSTLSAPFEKPVEECAGLGKYLEGPDLDVEHWEVTACVVREIGSEPVAIREISDAERKHQVVGGFAFCRSPCQLESIDAVGHVQAGVHGGALLPLNGGASADIPVDGVAGLMNIVSHGGTDPQGDISMLENMEAPFSSGIYGATDSLFCNSQFSSFISPLQTFPFSFLYCLLFRFIDHSRLPFRNLFPHVLS